METGRLIRRAIAIASALSLLLCVATSVMWVRSLRHFGNVTWRGPELQIEAESVDGVCGLIVMLDSPVGQPNGWSWWRGILPTGRDRASLSFPSFNRFGFGFYAGRTVGPPTGNSRFGDRLLLILYLPYWLLVAITAILPLRWWARLRGRQPWNQEGHCASCGYNLTGNTTGICPECGVRVAEARMKRRRQSRHAKLVTAAIAAIVLVPWIANTSLEQYRDYRVRKELSARRQRSLDYTAPPDWVVYDEDRGTADRLVASDPNYVRIGDGVCYVQPALRELPNARLGNGPPIVFLHGRRSPSGTICLVGVGLLALPGAAELRADLVFRVTKDDWIFSKASRPDLTLPRVNEQRITFFTGQPDPTEESHFTIGYRINYQSGIIDGWLRDDRSVKLQVRHDPAKTPHK